MMSGVAEERACDGGSELMAKRRERSLVSDWEGDSSRDELPMTNTRAAEWSEMRMRPSRSVGGADQNSTLTDDQRALPRAVGDHGLGAVRERSPKRAIVSGISAQ